jgi:transcriptional regulator with XRE-family HTH domain
MEQLLAQNVRRLCKEKKLQLKDLATRMGVDPSALNRALKGNARFDTIEKIANALDVSIKSLFEPTDDVEGFIRVGGKIYQFNSRVELRKILEENGQILGI